MGPTRGGALRAAIAVLAVAAITSVANCAHRAVAVPASSPPAAGRSKQVLAFYYGWYGNPATTGSWLHWSGVDAAARRIDNATHYPALGAYDTHSAAVVDQQCRWAKDAGVTGFIATWWRQGDFHDQGLPLLLDTASRFGLRVTVYFEQVNPDRVTAEGAAEDLLYILERYGRHPAWLVADGKPAIFVYGRALGQLKLTGWERVIAQVNTRYPGGALFIGDTLSSEGARVFDGLHTYNPTGSTTGKSVEEIRVWARDAFPKWIAAAGSGIACVTLLPGYDDTRLGRSPPRPTTDRHDGETYRVLWREAIDANPDWILISTWNEWHEGTEIEPSLEHGRRELETTTTFARRFLTTPRRVDVDH